MEPNEYILGVYADALTTLIKNHDLTKQAMQYLKKNFQLFADELNAQVNGIKVIQVGSSYDDLHLARLWKDEDGAYKFFPEVDFDFDMIYLDYVVSEDGVSTALEDDSEFGEKSNDLPFSHAKENNQTERSKITSAQRGRPLAICIMESSSNPGYVKLRVTPYGRQMLQKPGCRIGNFITSNGYLLSTAFTSGFVKEGDRTEIVYSRLGQFVGNTLREYGFDYQGGNAVYTKTGPAITGVQHQYRGYTYDFVHAFPCPTWPTVAKGWADRARRCHWPNEELIQDIVKGGCLLVAMGCHQSSDPSQEWRLSFVKAERMLSQSLSSLQKTCYSVVKVMLKSNLSERAILTSYHMKNIFYYLCEEIASASGTWTLDSLGEKIIQFLKYISVSLDVHRIPLYFLPPLNLIGHYSNEDVDATKKEVEAIIKTPFATLMEACNRLGCFDVKSSSQRFQNMQGELKPMFVIYTTSVHILWNLGCENIGEDFGKICFQKVVNLNAATSGYVTTGSHTFTAHSVPALLKPLAHAYTQRGEFDKALWLFLAMEELDPDLVASTYPNVLSNIACLYGNKSVQLKETLEVEKSSEYKTKAVLYFTKALSLIPNSPSLHLMYGNFLIDCKKPTVAAVEQFEKAIAINKPCDDDDALIQLTIPGAKDRPDCPCYVPGQVAAYYLMVQSCVNLMDIVRARKVAGQFEEYIREKSMLKHKVVSFRLCAFSYNEVGLIVKSKLLSAELDRYECLAKGD